MTIFVNFNLLHLNSWKVCLSFLADMSVRFLFVHASSNSLAFRQESGTAHSPVHNVYKRTDLYLCADHVAHTACIVTFGFFSISNCPTLSRQIGPW